jgi:hypothetical protein
MAYIRALVQIPRDTTLPEDVVTNTWHFDSDSGSADDVAVEIHAELSAFYTAMDVYMPTDLLVPTATVDYYDLAEAEPRVPVYTNTIALTLGVGTPMPPEVAVCLTYQGASGSGVNMRRRRGRIYLGPLNNGVLNVTGGRTYVSSTFTSALTAAATNLKAQTTTFGTKWAVFSPTTYAETGSLDDAFEDVVDGWVDNEFDIQRRRGTTAQIRSTWS